MLSSPPSTGTSWSRSPCRPLSSRLSSPTMLSILTPSTPAGRFLSHFLENLVNTYLEVLFQDPQRLARSARQRDDTWAVSGFLLCGTSSQRRRCSVVSGTSVVVSAHNPQLPQLRVEECQVKDFPFLLWKDGQFRSRVWTAWRNRPGQLQRMQAVCPQIYQVLIYAVTNCQYTNTNSQIQ